MPQPKCPRCGQFAGPDDTVELHGVDIVHVDCQHRRALSRDERALLFRYCWSHTVSACAACGERFRRDQLASDIFMYRSHLCPHCRADLTESMRRHLYACLRIPDVVRRQAQEARDASRRLVKQSAQVPDHADVLRREAEAAIAALRETMRRLASGS
jgi:hypothetical protein